MKKISLTTLLIFFLFASVVLSQPLSGDKIIKASGGDYTTLAAAINALNTNGASGTVRFLIDENLNEIGADLVVNLPSLNATDNLVIKPSVGKTPTIRINNCAPSTSVGSQADTAKRQAGLTFVNTGFVTIDGSNSSGGTSNDLTFLMGDATNGTQVLNFFGNCDNVVIKNIAVYYDSISTSTATRGIYCNGQWSGVVDSFVVQNCNIGNGVLDPYYCVSVTGSSTAGLNAGRVYLRGNDAMGRMRPLYFFRVGNLGETCEISGNKVNVVNAPASGNVVWGTLFNTYNGTMNVFGNQYITLKSSSASTNGIYGLGTLSGAAGVDLNIYNNFLGGDIQHDGTGIPASIDIISLQDNTASAKIYYNTIVFNNLTKTASSRNTCIRFGGTAVVDIKNNIIIQKKDAALAFGIYNAGGTMTSNYNNIFVTNATGNVGYAAAAAQQTLANWTAATSNDSNSVSKSVAFESDYDFHLTGTSIGDPDLVALSIPGITKDIDGDTRSLTAPYKGADEVPAAGMHGTYYVGVAGSGPGGTDPHFLSFRAALDSINNAQFSGDCLFLITSDITEPYSDTRGIGLAVNPQPHTIVFKPYTGVQPTITFNYPSDLNSGPSGAFIIGIPGKGNIAWDSLRMTRNIVIDGSNTAGGTTRDLTLQCATTAQRNGFPLVIVGDVSNVIVKNTNIYYKAAGLGSTSGNLFLGAVQVRSRNYLGVDWVPHGLKFENNHLSSDFDNVAQNAQGYVTYQSGTPLPVSYPYDIVLRDNLIEGKRRGIALYRAGSHDIYGNEIRLNQNVAANTTNEAILAIDVDTNSVVNIFRNKISKVSSMTNLAAMGNTAISIESFGTYNVHNNFIYGFSLTASSPTAYVRGIKNSSANATLNCYFNSIYMFDMAAGWNVSYDGIRISNGTNTLKNNIVYNGSIDFPAYCIYREGTNGTLVSDYNDFYGVDNTNSIIGYWNTAATQTLAAWINASGLDSNSLSVNPNFVSASDLHLQNTSSPVVGKGMAVEGITLDIDGENRDVIPEIGADEFPGFIPVELASFTANVSDGLVILNWETASETNNSHFVVERKSNNGDFVAIGQIDGAGTSVEKHKYTFVDNSVEATKYIYRLKQFDYDGSFRYYQELEVDLDIPTTYDLSQNYPNPFNPATTIRYAIPSDSKVTLEIYSVLGELVATLVNEVQSAGKYSVVFDARYLASGTYVYRLSANNTVITKKMMLLK